MASITPEQFRARFPEFSDTSKYTDDYINVFIGDTECEMLESAWGCFFAKGQAYLTAHYIAISEMTSMGPGSTGGAQTNGPISAETEGDTSVTYSRNSTGVQGGAGNDELIGSTLYGQQYLELRVKAVVRGTSSGGLEGGLPWVLG